MHSSNVWIVLLLHLPVRMVRGRRTRGPKAADEPICTSLKRKDIKVQVTKSEKKLSRSRGRKGSRLQSRDNDTDLLMSATSPKSQITNYFQAVNSLDIVRDDVDTLKVNCDVDPFDEVIENSGLTYNSCISLLQSQGVCVGAVSLKTIDLINGHSDSDTDSRTSESTSYGQLTNGFHTDVLCKKEIEYQYKNLDEIVDLTDSDCESKTEPLNTSPSLRLSPRKHASTLSRCAEANSENASTPHRIKFCDLLLLKTKEERSFNGPSYNQPDCKASKPLTAINGFSKDKVAVVPHCNDNYKSDIPTNHKLTEYFPVRRSIRKTKKAVLEEKMRDFEIAVREQKEDGLEVASFNGKGRGVITARDFQRGEFVVEYAGELIPITEARDREALYARTHAGCYMYYFRHNDVQYCIDATAETGRLGRLVNHSRNGNLIPRSVMVDRRPCLVLVAATDIPTGTELTYDYGDRSKESLKHHPWLAL